jgi:hypothetical protein
MLRVFRACAAAAPDGFIPGTDLFNQCVDAPDSEPNAHFSVAIKAAVTALQMRAAFQMAQLSELESLFSRSAGEIQAARRPFGDLPLEVLTSGVKTEADPSAVNAENSAARWAAHEALAHLSTRGIHRLISDSGHYVQLDKPEAVVGAVEEVMSQSAASHGNRIE